MTAQADGLLIHSHLVGVDGGFQQNALGVNRGTLQDLLHSGRQLLTVLGHGLRRAFLHLCGAGEDGVQPAGDVGGQLLSFHGAHFVICTQGLFQHGTEVRTDGLQILVLLRDGQNVRESGQRLRRQLVSGGAAQFRQLSQGGGVLGCQLPVDADLGYVGGGCVHRDEHVHLAPGDGPLDAGFHGLFRKAVHPGHLHRAVQIPVIDGAHLHGDVPLVELLPSPAVAGHTFDQNALPLSWLDKAKANPAVAAAVAQQVRAAHLGAEVPAAAQFRAEGAVVRAVGVLRPVFHIFQCLPVFGVAGVHLAGGLVVAFRLVHPAPAVADGAFQEVPLCVVVGIVGKQSLCPGQIAGGDGHAHLLEHGAAGGGTAVLLPVSPVA